MQCYLSIQYHFWWNNLPVWTLFSFIDEAILQVLSKNQLFFSPYSMCYITLNNTVDGLSLYLCRECQVTVACKMVFFCGLLIRAQVAHHILRSRNNANILDDDGRIIFDDQHILRLEIVKGNDNGYSDRKIKHHQKNCRQYRKNKLTPVNTIVPKRNH